MEMKGKINLVKGEYAFKNRFNNKSKKDVIIRHEKVFYSCKLEKDKIVCSDKTITDTVEVWY